MQNGQNDFFFAGEWSGRKDAAYDKVTNVHLSNITSDSHQKGEIFALLLLCSGHSLQILLYLSSIITL